MDEENFPGDYHAVDAVEPHDFRLKESVRRRLRDDTRAYLERGGEIRCFPPGDSGWVYEWRLPGSGSASWRAKT